MKTLKAVLLVMGLLVLGAAGWWYEYTGTPQDSLLLFANAVKAKDYETTRYFVDDERIADTASKSVLDAATSRFSEPEVLQFVRTQPGDPRFAGAAE